jgi:glycosyltransferase involved in cell wall biosynthesis
VPHDALPDWYRAADVTVLSSWSEGLPNVLRESLACGTPFVSTDVGSVREIAVAGWSRLADAGDPVGLADAIGTMLSGNVRTVAETYRARTWEECARQTASVLQNCRRGTRESSVHVPVLPDPRRSPGIPCRAGKAEHWTRDRCLAK